MARSSLLLWGFSFYFVLVVLVVPIICQTPPGPPVITGPASIKNGETVTIRCSSTGGDPTPTVKWLRDNVVLDDTSTTSGGVTVNEYTFTASPAEHLGVFECQTDNGVLQNPLTGTLFVIVNISPQTPTLTGTSNPAPNQQSTWTCTSTGGYPAPTMTMRIGNNQFSTSEFTTTSVAVNGAKSYTVTGTLNWSPTIGNNGQTLFCDVAHPATLDTPQTVSLPLTVISPLAISASPTFYNPTIGTSVTLNCVVTSGTATSITWLKGNSILNINGDARLTNGDVSNPSLSIINVQQSDSGSYVCRAADATGTVVNSNTITVTPQGTPPVVTIAQSSYSQLHGQQITLDCTVLSNNSPLQSVQWTFTTQGGSVTDPIVISTSSPLKYSGSTTSNPSLTVYSVTSTDEGKYRCRASNLIGTTTSNPTVLSVTGSIPTLQIPQNTYSDTYGNQVTIPCSITSATPSATHVYWTRNQNNNIININNGDSGYQGSTVGSPSLTINFATTGSNGVYTCFATNAAGTGSSNPTTLTITGGLLSVDVSPNSANVVQGTNQQITCTVTGTPAATGITWTRLSNNQLTTLDILNSNGKYTGGTTSNPHLSISNFQSSDAGTYVCRATNAAGSQNSDNSVLNYIQPLTLAISPPSGTATYGAASYTIQCQISGTTASSWSWTKTPINGGSAQQITQGSKYSIQNSPNNPVLTISNIVEADEADYACQATNVAGSASSSNSRLIVNGATLTVGISPTSANVLQSTNQLVQCLINGQPSANNIQWLRTINSIQTPIDIVNNGGKYSGGTTGNPHITINNFQSSDAGIYVCRVTNAYGTATSPTSTLTYIQSLSITINPPTGTAIVGDNSYQIQCQISGTTASSWSWTKTPINGGSAQPITQGSKYSIQNSPTNPFLTINNIVEADEADYACQATNVAGSASSSNSRLIVNGGALSVSVTPTTQNAVIGDNSVVIQCTVSGMPQATSWYWTFSPLGSNSQTTIAQGTNNGEYTVSNSNTNPHLTIKTITTANTGDYICRATNVVGTSSSQQSRLTVTGAVLSISISPASALVIQGNNQQIVCTVQGTPAAQSISWTRNGAPIAIDNSKYTGGNTANPSLTINSFQSGDAGNYVCSATNAAGTSTSGVSSLTYGQYLILTASPSSGSAVIGDASYVINCAISGSPTATSWYWVKSPVNGNAISTINQGTNNNKYTMGTNPTNPSLTIKSITQDDNANYRCQATNIAGERASNMARLLVTGGLLSVIVTPTQSSPNFGAASVMIQCSISGSPGATSVGWRKVSLNGQTSNIIDAVNSNGKYAIASSTTNPDLTINNINFDDDANYVCFATNLVGSRNSGNARVDVIGSQPQVSIPSTVYSIIYGNDVTIPCNIINSNPAHTIVTWYRVDNNGQLSSINVGDLNQYSGGTLNTPALTIKAADSSDIGAYRCAATNIVGEGQSSNTRLTVVGGLLAVSITMPGNVQLGNQATLFCSVSGTPSATNLYWEKKQNGGSYTSVDVSGNSRYSGGSLLSPNLVITNAAFSDSGTYRCLATNAAGLANSIDGTLNVVGSRPVVNVGSTTYSTNVGNRITLQCTVIANPAHTSVGWQRVLSNGNTQPIDMTNSRYLGVTLGSPSLIIDNTIKADEGNYVCIAANLVGSGQSQQTYLTVVGSTPTVTVPDPTYSVNRGSAITLECSYSANPPATQVRWRKNNVDLGDTAGNAKYGGSTTASASLIIYNAAESDEGSYQCTVTNSVGTGISTITTLDVVGNIPVVSVATDTYNVNLGETVTLQCSVTADPLHTSVYWQKVTGGSTSTIIINNSKYEGSTVSNPSLTIKNAVSGDAGTYYCYATNSVGTGGSTQVVIGVTGNKPSVSLTRSAITANYGETVTIQCEVVANPAATSVYWQKLTTGNNAVTIDTSNTAKYGGATVASPSLIIRNLDSSDIANYICFAANSVGTGQSGQGSLNVIGSNPTVTIGQNTYTQNTGKNIVIGCTVTSFPAHTSVSWTRKIGNNAAETITATGGTKYSISSNINAPSLTIYNIQESDEGVYTCFATNVVGTGQSNPPARLNVIGNMPIVTASIPTTATRLGNPVTITCTVSANPGATRIFWQIINPATKQGVNIDTSIAKYSGGTLAIPSLTINPVEESDEGNYQCLAENAIGTTTSNQVYLDTIGDPPTSVTVTPSPIVVEEGNMITATCTATGNPQPTFRWFRSTDLINPIDNDAVLNVLNAKESDKGSYVCRASNKFGTNDAIVTADVQFRPKVVIPDLTISGKKGLTAEIRCTQTSNPLATTLTWTKIVSSNAISTIAIDNNKYFGGSVLSPTLTITNLDASDEASYRCSATNAVGTGSSQIAVLTVDLSSPPIGINIYPNGITVLEGKDFSMYCNATGNPIPQYQWFHDDVMIREGQTYSISVSEYNAHDGLYTCKAYNSAGYLQKSIDVDVKYPPISNIKDNTFTPALNNPVTLQCDTLANPSAVQWHWYYGTFRLTDVPDNQKDYVLDMNNANDAGEYSCVAFNEVGQSSKLTFTVTLDTAVTTTQVTGPDTGETVSSAGLSGGEIAAICLGVLFFILLLIALIVCCILQGCCACCAVAAGKDKERRITPDREKLDIPRFYEVPTVVTREPSLISKRDVSLHMAPMYSDDRYVTSASRPYYLPAIEYTYDEEERRRRHRKKKKSRHHHDDLQRNEQIVLEERVVAGNDVYRTSGPSRVGDEVVTGPEFYFEAE